MATTHADGGRGSLSSTLTTVLNSAAFDRYIKIHVSVTTAGTVTFDRGTGTFAKLVDAFSVSANTPYSFGPFFLPNGHSLRGGITTGAADYSLDEMRVNQ